MLPWLGEREDFLLRLAKEYFVGLQPDPVAAGVFGRLFDLGLVADRNGFGALSVRDLPGIVVVAKMSVS